MAGDPEYARGILSGIVYKLAVGEGDVKDRLGEAFYPSTPLFVSDLPNYLVSHWEEIHDRLLRKKESSPYQYSVNGNLYGMHKKTAAKFAAKLWFIWRELEIYCEQEKQDKGCSQVDSEGFISLPAEKSPWELFKDEEKGKSD